MSASLVGSEMCIRDSPEAPRARAGLRAGDAPLALEAPAETHALEAPSSVSYTHLTLPTICSV
eukprot:6601842-Alexandrium_andersonii.AAC.1